MGAKSREVGRKTVGESRTGKISFADLLDAGELLTADPSPTVADASGDLTISAVARNSSSMSVQGETVAANQGIKFLVAGGTAGTTYDLLVTATTDSTPAQVFKRRVRLEVVAD